MSANGESPVTLSINQLRVIICIFIAIKETNEPIHIHRKSLYESESRIVDKRNVGVADFAEVGALVSVGESWEVLDEKAKLFSPLLWKTGCEH